MVFPSGTHSRFEHCIGTAFLCQKYMDILIQRYKGKGQYYEDEQKAQLSRRLVTLAGLLHDIGHGPFSHMFDNEFMARTMIPVGEGKEAPWSHELAGHFLIKGLYQQGKLVYHDKPLSEENLERLISLIDGSPYDNHNVWEYEIVSNKLTGIDVDKLDYFRRDSFYLGIKNVFVEYELLMDETRIINSRESNGQLVARLCYPVKYSDKVLDLFHSRYKLYKGYYQNRIVQGIEIMLCEVFSKMDHKYHIREICHNISTNYEAYCKLTDNLVFEVLRSDDPSLQPAQHILKKIQTRKIYAYVAETDNLSGETELTKGFFNMNEEEIRQQVVQEANGMIEQDEISIRKSVLSYGNREKHPI